MKKHFEKGFTLIELMIVIAVIAILVTIALPSYQTYMQQARRTEAKAAILDVQLAEEKWRTNNATYTTDLSASGLDLTTSFNATNLPNYTIAVTTPTAPATNYTVVATIRAGSDQVGDACGSLTLTVSTAGDVYTDSAGNICW